MLWNSGEIGDERWENPPMRRESTGPLWITVENARTTIMPPTRHDACSSPIHRPYYNNTKINWFFVGRRV